MDEHHPAVQPGSQVYNSPLDPTKSPPQKCKSPYRGETAVLIRYPPVQCIRCAEHRLLLLTVSVTFLTPTKS